jgi:hypothetical protein
MIQDCLCFNSALRDICFLAAAEIYDLISRGEKKRRQIGRSMGKFLNTCIWCAIIFSGMMNTIVVVVLNSGMYLHRP